MKTLKKWSCIECHRIIICNAYTLHELNWRFNNNGLHCHECQKREIRDIYLQYGGGMNDVCEEYIIYEEGMIVEEIEKPDDMEVSNKTDPEKFRPLKVLEIGIDNI